MGCSVSRAHKTWSRSLLFKVFFFFFITAGRCKKILHRLRSQPERDKFFAALNYFFMDISL